MTESSTKLYIRCRSQLRSQNKLHTASTCLFSFSVPFPIQKANKILIRFSLKIYGSLEAGKCLTPVLNEAKLWLPEEMPFRIETFDVQYEERKHGDRVSASYLSFPLSSF